MENVFLFLVMVVCFGVIGLCIYKYRSDIQKWIHDPKYRSTWHPSRETYLKRTVEDAEAELKWLGEDEE